MLRLPIVIWDDECCVFNNHQNHFPRVLLSAAPVLPRLRTRELPATERSVAQDEVPLLCPSAGLLVINRGN